MKSSRRLHDRTELIPLVVVLVLFCVLIFRLFFLQIVRAQTYRRLSEDNRIRVIPVDAPRGHVLDRNENVLVCNRPSYVVSIVPFKLRQMEQTIEILADFLGMEPGTIMARLRETGGRRFEPAKIKRDIDFQTLAVIQEHKLDLPGVIYQVEPRREYLYGDLAAHLLGTVGEISSRELAERRSSGYRHGSLIGKGGLEKQYERFLRGEDGVQYVEVSAVGREIGPLPDRPAVEAQPGNDLILTIDLALQQAAEEALSDSAAGAVVALDPDNGEILAMVSRPTFDPNLFSSVIPESTWRALNEDPGRPLFNRAIQSTYPPASILKVLTAAAGLETGVINAHTRFSPCTGAFKYGDRWFGCWQSWGHGSLSLVDALAQSCDVYFYQLGPKVGLDRWSDFVTRCGLGKTLGVDLAGEARGLVPDRDYFNDQYGGRNWGPGVLLNLSIGQGENLVTPLQMASLMAAVGNGGVIHKPHLVREIRSLTGKSLHQESEVIGRLPISTEHLRLLKRALRAVVHHHMGTGRRAAVAGFEVAGKTGTAQNPHGEDHAWFAAFAPVEQPRIAVAVIVEQAGHGGSVAAPIAGRVMEAYLRGDAIQ
jgi:penicillin-binding protein 2